MPVEAVPPTHLKAATMVRRQQFDWQNFDMQFWKFKETRPEHLTTKTLELCSSRRFQHG